MKRGYVARGVAVTLVFAQFLFGLAKAETLVQSGCIVIGERKTDQNVWQLCPNGDVYEDEYLYWGYWNGYRKVLPTTAPCRWESGDSTWRCKRGTIQCKSGH